MAYEIDMEYLVSFKGRNGDEVLNELYMSFKDFDIEYLPAGSIPADTPKFRNFRFRVWYLKDGTVDAVTHG